MVAEVSELTCPVVSTATSVVSIALSWSELSARMDAVLSDWIWLVCRATIWSEFSAAIVLVPIVLSCLVLKAWMSRVSI